MKNEEDVKQANFGDVMNRDFSFWFYGTLLIAVFVSCVAYVAMSLV